MYFFTIYHPSDSQVRLSKHQQPQSSKPFLDKTNSKLTVSNKHQLNTFWLPDTHLHHWRRSKELLNQRDYEQLFHGRTKLSRSSDPTTYDSELYQPGRSIYFILQTLHNSLGEVQCILRYITVHHIRRDVMWRRICYINVLISASVLVSMGQ